MSDFAVSEQHKVSEEYKNLLERIEAEDDAGKEYRSIRQFHENPDVLIHTYDKQQKEDEEEEQVKDIQAKVQAGEYVPEAYIRDLTLDREETLQKAEAIGASEDWSFLRLGKQAMAGVSDAFIGLTQDAHDLGNTISQSMRKLVTETTGWDVTDDDPNGEWLVNKIFKELTGKEYLISFGDEDGYTGDGVIEARLNQLSSDKAQGTAEEAVRGISRFVASWVGAMRVAKMGAVSAGFAADMFVAEGYEGAPMFTELMASMPGPQQDLITDYINSSEDNEAYRRMQHGFEGLFLGAVGDVAVKHLVGIAGKAAKVFKKAAKVDPAEGIAIKATKDAAPEEPLLLDTLKKKPVNPFAKSAIGDPEIPMHIPRDSGRPFRTKPATYSV